MPSLPRFYPILDTAACETRHLPVLAVAEALLEAGARILQFRHKDAWTEAVFQQAKQIALLAQQAGATFVINDRADYAVLLSAGVHVGQEDLPPAAVRRVMGNGLVGFSTHNRAQLLRGDREAVDYLALGPMFVTTSKANPDPVVGPLGLKELRPLTPKPLVAIGGITMENASQVLDAGADSVALIGALLPAGGNIANVKDRAAQWITLLSQATSTAR